MDSLFFHPKLVHLPIALSLLVPLLAGALLLAWWRGWLPARAWTLAVLFQALLVGSGIAAMQSGEDEEDRVEPFTGKAPIDAHEEAAERFVYASGGVLALMLLALALSSRRTGAALAVLSTLGALGAAWLGYQTGHAGGALVYQFGAGSAYADPALMPPSEH